ncbi:methylated-DNA--[protein]-cysteine S-methyltransferase [Aestuariibacter sp. GS-14]|uniref:methylated-DNA--[protein]-cysteine S-methyltransferase n=1 Tax=Aestuariibacter sp. GS-14 TaxID=2590670 RepID=UPI00112C7653|nr:methylated-DNA--[protein]-cysteine S-methyltransferase [Aestuariibacter sp. GS-14]TPV59028.1 methylated-DNA--[protein]-cysteine S-methyltransferase [Aestuariibacter sp. GS-14]
MQYTQYISSPLGPILIQASEQGVSAVKFVERQTEDDKPSPITHRCYHELNAYFAGSLTTFTVPVDAQGTSFQQRVWQQLCKIPFGHSQHYGQIASALGKPTASRAVGMANGRNPVSIIVPCHRVIGKNGTLTGYAGGLSRKQALLELEGIAYR